MQLNAYTIALFSSALVSGGLAVYAWRRRSVTGGEELALLMLSVAVWSLCVAVEGATTVRYWKIFWSAASYLGSQSTPVLFLLAVMRYTQKDKWLTRWRIALLWVIPFVSVVMALTNGLHGLLWTKITLTHTVAGVTAVYTHGPWYWVAVAYGYACVIVGIVALLSAVVQLPHPYSWQSMLLITATLVPVASHLVYAFSPSSVEGLDITPIAFTVTGVLVVIAVFRYHLLDLRPIASNVLYDGIRDAMVAVDAFGRVVDMNPAAQDLTGEPVDRAIGRPAADVFRAMPSLVERLEPGEVDEQGEIQIEQGGRHCYYNLRAWPLRGRRDHLLGRLIALHDVTEIRLVQEELERINAELDGYAHTVSHDLKNPIHRVVVSCHTVENLLRSPLTEETRESITDVVEIALGGLQNANRLIEDLLALAESGQVPRSVDLVDISDAVTEIIDERMDDIDQNGVTVELDEDLGYVIASSTHIHQLFDNLIRNAIAYNDSDAPVIEVRRVAAFADGGGTYLVRDNGSGIPADIIDSVFVSFVKGRVGSTGIGLSIAEKIVKVYGGSIRAYNDGGACFEFVLRDMVVGSSGLPPL
jgi:PAS domain S-box-containing protein